MNQERSPIDELLDRMGNKLGRLQTEHEYAQIQLGRHQARVQELEAEVDKLRGELAERAEKAEEKPPQE